MARCGVLVVLAALVGGSVVRGAASERHFDGTRQASQVSSRDSSGVVLLANPEGAEERAPIWTVGPRPSLSIGRLDGVGPDQLSIVLGVTRFDNGNILLVDGQTREVRTFRPDGTHLRTFGGMGEGPGEFTLPTLPTMRMPGDTVAIWDLSQHRFTFVISDGTYAGNLRTRSPFMIPVGFLDRRVIVTEGGGGVVPVEGMEGLRAGENLFQRIDLAEGGATDSIVRLGRHLQVVRVVGGIPSNTFVPFTARASVGVDSGRVVVADGRPRELRVFDESGRLVRIIRVAGAATPLTSGEFRTEVARRMESISAAREPILRRQYAEMPIPETKPAYSGTLLGGGTRILLGASGMIWVERFHPRWGELRRFTDPEPSRWTVFSAEGRVLATAAMPPGFTPYEITPVGVLGVYRGEYDLETVWLLEVHRRP